MGMLCGTWGTSLLGNLLRVKVTDLLEQMKTHLEEVSVFNTSSSFNKLFDTKVLTKMNLNLMVFIQEIIYLK